MTNLLKRDRWRRSSKDVIVGIFDFRVRLEQKFILSYYSCIRTEKKTRLRCSAQLFSVFSSPSLYTCTRGPIVWRWSGHVSTLFMCARFEQYSATKPIWSGQNSVWCLHIFPEWASQSSLFSLNTFSLSQSFLTVQYLFIALCLTSCADVSIS